MLKKLFFVAILWMATTLVLAKGVYLTAEEFISSSFDAKKVVVKTLWLQGENKKNAEKILDHSLGLRTRYWMLGSRTAWIFNEIGKELPITIGVVVEANRILDVRILAFRESRGGEVRYPYFTKQFYNLMLANNNTLSGSIDGISGATMSVNAVTRAVKAALHFHSMIL